MKLQCDEKLSNLGFNVNLRCYSEEHGIKLAAGRTQFLEKARYKGARGENSDNTHAFPVFADDDGGAGAGAPPPSSSDAAAGAGSALLRAS